ncbi:MAG: hypothetical protein AAGJ82_07830 [Bacteroidota bacterium]
MKTYTIHPNQRNFRPREWPWPRWKANGFRVGFIIEPGAWCSLEDYEGDLDRNDYQKIAGLTHFFSLNNRRTALFAFNYGDELETYNLVAYLNDEKGGWTTSNQMIFKSGKLVEGRCVLQNDYAHFTAQQGEARLNWQHGFRAPKLTRRVGTYPGGENNSPGPHGGKALKKMVIQLSFETI